MSNKSGQILACKPCVSDSLWFLQKWYIVKPPSFCFRQCVVVHKSPTHNIERCRHTVSQERLSKLQWYFHRSPSTSKIIGVLDIPIWPMYLDSLGVKLKLSRHAVCRLGRFCVAVSLLIHPWLDCSGKYIPGFQSPCT